MKEHGLMFKGYMVRALLLDKTQTRRTNLNTKYAVGDRIWVKETYTLTQFGKPVFRADSRDSDGYFWTSVASDPKGVKWKSSMLMPRRVARILLEITALRDEPLGLITDDDARAEGVAEYAKTLPDSVTEEMSRVEGYIHLWESINGPGSWNPDQVVRVITFKRVTP